MRCQTCQGTECAVQTPSALELAGFLPPYPCPDCGGSGIAHCCEGDRACPGTAGGEQGQCEA